MEGKADSLREEGNALYKAGKLDQAIVKYKLATKEAPSSSAPFRNLSAAYYEVGNYRQCITTAEKALELVERSGEADISQYAETLKKRIGKARECFERSSLEEQKQTRMKIMSTLKRYRPSMIPVLEHYTVGHDDVLPMFDISMNMYNPSDPINSFFFGGIGDARHFYKTIHDIVDHEKSGKTPKKKYHFTLIDINIYALARDLIVFLLLEEFSQQNDMSSEKATDIMCTIYYVYISAWMPSASFDHLQKIISAALGDLKSGKQPLVWLHIHPKDFTGIVDALGTWQNETLDLLPPKELLKRTITEQKTSEARSASIYWNYVPQLATFKQEKVLFRYSALLLPPQSILRRQEKKLQSLLTQHFSDPKANAATFKKFLRVNWKFNVTFISLDWYKDCGQIDLSQDPFQQIIKLFVGDSPPVHESGSLLYDVLEKFFIPVAQSINALRGRFQAEMAQGDCIDTLERLRYDLYVGENPMHGKWARPDTFPCTYDRIHLSNIPDYIGGHLSTTIYAGPVLKRQNSSLVLANCLLNTPSFSTIWDYVAEYQHISTHDMLLRLTQMRLMVGDSVEHHMSDYAAFGPASVFSPTPKQKLFDLLPRQPFCEWFYAMFLKLALPFPCGPRHSSYFIYSPLNLTILFRLIPHLRSLGYPTHWMSSVLIAVITNTVTTSSRPPRSIPQKPADVEKFHPNKPLVTSHLKDETATLVQLFSPLLPFSIPKSLLPSLDTIYQYSIHFPHYNGMMPAPSCLILVFWDPNLYDEILEFEGDDAAFDPTYNFRDLLDPRPLNELHRRAKGPANQRFKQEGSVVWGTFEFQVDTKKAKVWMPCDLVDNMVEKGWVVGMFRTDLWNAALTDVEEELGNVVEKGQGWVDWKEIEESAQSRADTVDKFEVDVETLSIASLD